MGVLNHTTLALLTYQLTYCLKEEREVENNVTSDQTTDDQYTGGCILAKLACKLSYHDSLVKAVSSSQTPVDFGICAVPDTM